MRSTLILFVLAAGSISCSQSPNAVGGSHSTGVKTGNADQDSNHLQYDFGVVEKDMTYPASIEFKNLEDAPLVIQECRTSCGCLKVNSMPTRIGPGETASFEISLDTRGKLGVQNVRAVFVAAPPSNRIVVLGTRAIVRSCWVSPDGLSFGDLTSASVASKRLSVLIADWPDATVLSVSPDVDWITVRSDSRARNEKSDGQRVMESYLVDVHLDKLSPGAFSGRVNLVVRADDDISFSVPVTGFLSGEVVADPSRIVFGRIAGGSVVRQCKLTFSHPVDLKGATFTTESSSIKVVVDRWDEAARELTLSLQASHSDNGTGGLIQGNLLGAAADGTILFRVPYVGLEAR
jgi:hypothetical protein